MKLDNILINQFLSKLIDSKIRYVHWKSNTNILAALDNKDDLDILVHPEDQDKISLIFSELNIIRAYSVKDNWQPKIYHYIGYDVQSMELVHVHLHYGLVLGYDFDKNFELPITNEYLDNSVNYYSLIKIPQVEKEYIILVIRLILKNSLSPFLLHLPHHQFHKLRTQKKGVVSGSGYREYLDLKKRSDYNIINKLLIEHFSQIISLQDFLILEKILDENNSLLKFFQGGIKLKRILKKYQLKSELQSLFVSFIRLNKLRIGKIITYLSKNKIKGSKVPETGGKIFAFVGGDGAGKSTNVKELNKVLSKHFKTVTIHVGRPWRSNTGILITLLQKVVKLFQAHDLSKALVYLALAFDRKNAFQFALKKREEGVLVIQDRIPLDGITSMDCPRIATIGKNKFQKLSALEKKIYKQITGVDELYVLKLDPRIALLRRPEDDPDELKIRSGEIWNNNWKAPYAFIVDTGRNDSQNIKRQILDRTWKRINTEFLRIEILGLNGSGKTSLMNEVLKNTTNVKTNISMRNHTFVYIKSLFSNLFSTIDIIIKTGNINIGREYIHYKSSIQLMEKWKKNKRYPATNFVLDQGPLFQTALFIKEGFDEKIQKKETIQIHNFFSKYYYLTAPRSILWHRVQNRKQQKSRGEILDFNQFETFCYNYDNAFEKLKIEMESIDTSELSPQEIYQEKLKKHFECQVH